MRLYHGTYPKALASIAEHGLAPRHVITSLGRRITQAAHSQPDVVYFSNEWWDAIGWGEHSARKNKVSGVILLSCELPDDLIRPDQNFRGEWLSGMRPFRFEVTGTVSPTLLYVHAVVAKPATEETDCGRLCVPLHEYLAGDIYDAGYLHLTHKLQRRRA